MNKATDALPSLPDGNELAALGNLPRFLAQMLNGVAYCQMLYDDGIASDFLYLYTNPAFHQHSGLGPVVGRRVSEIIPGIREANPELFHILARVAAGGSAENVEILVKGIQRWVSIQAFSPKPAHFVAVFSDITASKRAEAARAASERRYHNLLEDQTEVICRFQADGTILYANTAFCRMFDKSRESLIGNKWQPIAWPEDVPLIHEKLATLSPSNPVVTIENRVMTGKGVRWGQFVNRAFFDAEGQLEEIQAVGRDVTERRNAEDARSELVNRLTRIATQVPGLIYQYLIRPDGSSCFPYASEAIREYFGVSPEDVREDASAVFAKLHPEDYDGVIASIQHAVTTLEPWQYEARVCHHDGTIHWLYGNAVLERQDDDCVLCHGFVSDITARKEMEQRLAQSLRENKAVVDSHLVGILRVKDRQVVWANAPFADMFGYASDEVIGQSPRIFHPSDQAYADFESTVLPAIQDGQVFEQEIQQVRKDGTRRWFKIICELLDPVTHEKLGAYIDVTDRKLAEQALIEESHKNQALLQNASDGIHILDTGGRIIEASESFSAMLGYRHDEVIGMHVSQWDAKFTGQDLTRLVESLYAKGGRSQFETRHRRTNGTLIDVEVSTSPLSLSGADVLFCCSRDITERKQAETNLREAEYLYRSLANGLSTLIWRSGPDKLCNYFNEPWLRFTGRTLEQEMGNGWIEGVHPDDLERCFNTYVSAFDRREPFSMDYRLRHADGTYHWISDDGTPTYDSQGAFLGYIGACNDIGVRRQAEAQVRDAEQRLESALNWSHTGAWDFDLVNHSAHRSLEHARIFGYEPPLPQWSYDMFLEHVLAEDRAEVDRKIRTASTKQSALNFECRIRRFDGKVRWIWVAGGYGSNSDGTVQRMTGIVRDITDRKHAEAELEQHRHHLEALVDARTADLSIAKEAAEAASRAKDAFLAVMSHELRTPLNAIMGMTELAQRRATDPKQSEQLNKVKTASNNLLALVKDILDISRIEASKLTLQQIDFRLDSVIANLRDMVGHSAAAKHLDLSMEIPAALAERTLLGDPLRLGQVLLNLTANAIKFTAQGAVTLRAAMVDDSPDAVVIQFEVQDTGIGIAEADQQRVFEPFEQADGSYTRKYGGTGLGLSISKRLVELMGGTIGVHSTVGVGSTFWFIARLGKSGHAALPGLAALPHASRDQLRSQHTGAYLLVVDDDALNREITEGLLAEAGLVVHVAADGATAVAMANRTNYDAILMDVQMPEVDGYQATARIRQLKNNPDVPILALTANVFPEDEARCLAAGMNDFIGRPVEPEVLFATLLKWLVQPPK